FPLTRGIGLAMTGFFDSLKRKERASAPSAFLYSGGQPLSVSPAFSIAAMIDLTIWVMNLIFTVFNDKIKVS
ncbi:hypothetical protein L0P50_07945, partial [Lawsonibacter sp. DFI.6.74]|nr:hypothetical protein [Lawsonibacter sp. DFI.6.74]MCG4773255.1 hypothetical protein [Lawsonibacter sp. DFI.5.51]